MLAIAAAGAFVGLFALWVILPRKFLRDKPGRQRPSTRYAPSQEQNPPDNPAPCASSSA